nr:LysE family transporter [Paenibacillus aestuarii]
MLYPLLKGIILGLSIAAPVGPIGILCIRRTLTLGRLHGFLSGLGAATADACYGFMAGFGLTLVTSFLLDQRMLLQGAGGLFLLYLGVQTYRANPARDPAKASSKTLFKSYASTLMLTITNPMTILSFVGVFAGLGIGHEQGNWLSATSLVAGVFIGSALWWLMLCLAVGLLRERLHTEAFRWINRISGSIVIIFGILALLGIMKGD